MKTFRAKKKAIKILEPFQQFIHETCYELREYGDHYEEVEALTVTLDDAFYWSSTECSTEWFPNCEMLKEQLKSDITLREGLKVRNVIGRRWFQKSYGNTYCTAEIVFNDGTVVKMPMTYGYGDHYLTEASKFLKSLGYDDTKVDLHSYSYRMRHGILARVVDVAREKDL
jgi:hypothetical protein